MGRLNLEVVKIIHSPEFKKRMDDIGAEPVGNTSEQMAQPIKDDTERFSKLVRVARISIEQNRLVAITSEAVVINALKPSCRN